MTPNPIPKPDKPTVVADREMKTLNVRLLARHPTSLRRCHLRTRSRALSQTSTAAAWSRMTSDLSVSLEPSCHLPLSVSRAARTPSTHGAHKASTGGRHAAPAGGAPTHATAASTVRPISQRKPEAAQAIRDPRCGVG